jgi:hypothetical protein
MAAAVAIYGTREYLKIFARTSRCILPGEEFGVECLLARFGGMSAVTSTHETSRKPKQIQATRTDFINSLGRVITRQIYGDARQLLARTEKEIQSESNESQESVSVFVHALTLKWIQMDMRRIRFWWFTLSLSGRAINTNLRLVLLLLVGVLSKGRNDFYGWL